jgi:hypothetical protein
MWVLGEARWDVLTRLSGFTTLHNRGIMIVVFGKLEQPEIDIPNLELCWQFNSRRPPGPQLPPARHRDVTHTPVEYALHSWFVHLSIFPINRQACLSKGMVAKMQTCAMAMLQARRKPDCNASPHGSEKGERSVNTKPGCDHHRDSDHKGYFLRLCSRSLTPLSSQEVIAECITNEDVEQQIAYALAFHGEADV